MEYIYVIKVNNKISVLNQVLAEIETKPSALVSVLAET